MKTIDILNRSARTRPNVQTAVPPAHVAAKPFVFAAARNAWRSRIQESTRLPSGLHPGTVRSATKAGNRAAAYEDAYRMPEKNIDPWGPDIEHALRKFPQVAASARHMLRFVHDELLLGTDACSDWNDDYVHSPLDWEHTVGILQDIPQDEWGALVNLAIDCQLAWQGKPRGHRNNTSENFVPMWEVRFSPNLGCFEAVLEALSRQPQGDRARLAAQAMDYLVQPLRRGNWIETFRDQSGQDGLFTILNRYAREADCDLLESIGRAAAENNAPDELLLRTLIGANQPARARLLHQIESAKLWAAGDYEGALQRMQAFDQPV